MGNIVRYWPAISLPPVARNWNDWMEALHVCSSPDSTTIAPIQTASAVACPVSPPILTSVGNWKGPRKGGTLGRSHRGFNYFAVNHASSFEFVVLSCGLLFDDKASRTLSMRAVHRHHRSIAPKQKELGKSLSKTCKCLRLCPRSQSRASGFCLVARLSISTTTTVK